ncbi:MAG: hypothetical protein WBF35_02480 [Candidatus Acidiferrales bacterium]
MPVATTENIAVCPAVTVLLAGFDVIAGAVTGGFAAVCFTPLPETSTVVLDPVDSVNVSTPEYSRAAAGVKVTSACKVWRALKVTGSAGPEYANWGMDDCTAVTLTVSLLSFVSVTVSGALVVPTAC